MKPLTFSPAAISDLNGIWDYSAEQWGLDQADLYIDELRDACHALACGHKHGRPVDLRSGYLRILAGAHVIYYQDRDDRISVIRILHSRMDVDRNL